MAKRLLSERKPELRASTKAIIIMKAAEKAAKHYLLTGIMPEGDIIYETKRNGFFTIKHLDWKYHLDDAISMIRNNYKLTAEQRKRLKELSNHS
jgi:hypothetical protein